MSTKMIQVKVQKEAYEVGVLLRQVLIAIKAKKPITQIAQEEFATLVTAVNGIDELPEEAREDILSFTNAFLIPVGEGMQAMLSKSVETVPVVDAQSTAKIESLSPEVSEGNA